MVLENPLYFRKKAKEIGYKTYLYFICLDDPTLNISRVWNRTEKGGHNVPSDKIINRYYRTLDNLYPALRVCGKAFLFDNSAETMVLIAEVLDGQIKLLVGEEELPNWFITYVLNKL